MIGKRNHREEQEKFAKICYENQFSANSALLLYFQIDPRLENHVVLNHQQAMVRPK